VISRISSPDGRFEAGTVAAAVLALVEVDGREGVHGTSTAARLPLDEGITG
jgi:hypothetical protein